MKRILSVILVCCLLTTLCGCSKVNEVWDTFYSALTVEQRPHIGFSNGTLFEDSKETVYEISELTEKETVSSGYRGSMFYSTLTDAERTVYTALEYAMEQGYTNILVDDLLVPDTVTLEKIVHFLAFDSPLLEQNLRYETGDFTTYYENGFLGNAAFDGFYITVKNFTSEFWDKKLEAIKKAEEIVAALPEEISLAEKADRIYRTVAKAEYYDYDLADNENVYPYLYDALVTGKTHCDGYTNAISLLYNMVGIECVEKNYTPETEEGIGHTWNLFCIDGKWYNCDGTGSGMIPKKDCGMGAGYLFGFGDMLQQYDADYSEMYPESTEGLYIQVDAYIAVSGNNGFYNAASQAFKAHGNNWALVLTNTCDEADVDAQVQRLANRFYTSVQYYLYIVKDNRTAIFVCRAGLCE